MSTKKQTAAKRRSTKSTGPQPAPVEICTFLGTLRQGLHTKIPLPRDDFEGILRLEELYELAHQPQTVEQACQLHSMASANWELRYFQWLEVFFLAHIWGGDPILANRCLKGIVREQRYYQREFWKAFKLYKRALRAELQPRSRPPA
jgi:hypothetical protein